ncbi:hypothetical protein BKA58DRAFT_114656 [Alternaria rosae]|uniref:uncharacterized protein n=1 Tax=Alternaria rosae TaxID=1187941 RepID=UPI001E8D8DAD|nr:uncharacterized protein BKA58DRAFT_114656 [Alternaria rosae]KAH6875038.1 hypothetical protein BKA58DRAFT_114656 [Alternaria rosae]
MALTALPRELFDNVIRLLTEDETPLSLPKYRLICRAFKDPITDEIAKKPTGDFLRRGENSARHFLMNKDFLGTHLGYLGVRAFRGKPCGRLPYLPRLIADRLVLLRQHGVMQQGQELKFALMLGKTLAVQCDSAFTLAITASTSQKFVNVLPRFTINGANLAVELFATTAAAGDTAGFEKLVTQFGTASLFRRSYAFGYAIATAAGGNHMRLVLRFLTWVMSNYRTVPNDEYDLAIMDAIDASLAGGHSDMARLLLEVYHRFFPVIQNDVYNRWLALAVKLPDNRIYKALAFTIRRDPNIRSHIITFKMACRSGDRSMVRMFITSGILDPNQGYFEQMVLPSLENALQTAVAAGKVGPVEELLLLGAHPDGLPTAKPRARPLRLALVDDHLEVFRLLLVWGADTQSIWPQWYDVGSKMQPRRRPFFDLIQSGIGDTFGYWNDLVRRGRGFVEELE